MHTVQLLLKTSKYERHEINRRFHALAHLHNVCVKHARKCMIRLQHDKRYAELRQLYNELVKKEKMSKEEKSQKKKLAKQLAACRTEQGLSKASLEHYLKVCGKQFSKLLSSQQVQAEADRVWCGVERCLFGNGKNLHFKKYMDFVERFVSRTIKELVDVCHSYGKEAMMFLGDDWIGAEPYGEHFKDMHLDAVVGSVGGGVTVRMLSEIPHVKYHEGRFLPYFFPDTFFDGNEQGALDELNKNWLTARRAIMRKPIDRMGFGGYLSLAAKFPKFVDRVAEIADEFRSIYDAVDNKKPYCRLKVGLLNAWGKTRSWMSHMVAHELWYQQIYSYQGILEAVSGLPVDIEFLSFDDVKNGVNQPIDLLINAGDAYTSFSGGKEWLDEKLQTAIRKFVYNGGGFIGVGEPTACEGNGRYFQLADVLGVDEEVGFTLSNDKYNITKVAHELTDGLSDIDYGEDKKNIYALDGTKVLDIAFSDRFKRSVNVGEVKMAVNEYGKGRSFYITGIPYSFENSRLLYKAMCWTANKPLNVCFATNVNVECNYYESSGKYALVNNSSQKQTTEFYDKSGNKSIIELKPMEIKWIKE